MTRAHDAGFFTARFKSNPGVYRFRLQGYDNAWYEMEDPYRFPPVVSDFDLHLFLEGTNFEAYNALGAHLATVEGVSGTRFAVWAPNALIVSVVGDFNGWDTRQNPMRARVGGVWEIFLPGVNAGTAYKYSVKSRHRGYSQLKADPYGFAMEMPPKSASIVTDLDTYQWRDEDWLQRRANTRALESPVSIYEVHLGSWRKNEHGRVHDVSRTGEHAGRVRQGYGIHPYRVDADGGTSVCAILGLSGDGLLRSHQPLRIAQPTSCTSLTAAIRRGSA